MISPFYTDSYELLPENHTNEQLEEYQYESMKMMLRTIATFFVLLILLALCSLFTSCDTCRESTSSFVMSQTDCLS